MGFFEDARKVAGNFGQEAARHVGSATGETWKYGSAFGQEVAKHAGPVAADARNRLDKLGKEAGKHASPIANSAWKAIMSAQSVVNNANRDARALPQIPNEDLVQESDWKFIAEFGEDMAKRLGSTADDFWQKLSTGDLLNDIGQAALPKIVFTEEDLSGFSEKLKAWILSNPRQFATLLACIASGPIVFFVTPVMLGLVGFTPIGIAGASAFQASVGPIAAGSAFAIFTSAGMGGYGLVIVQAIAVGSSVTGTCGTAAVAFLEVVKRSSVKRIRRSRRRCERPPTRSRRITNPT